MKDSGNPFAEPPRLGIIHLLVWTACVAFYLGIIRSFWLLLPGGSETSGALIFANLFGMANGTALGGLVLFAARRYRRIRFPVHPGEVLLVALGVSTVLGLILYVPFLLYVSINFHSLSLKGRTADLAPLLLLNMFGNAAIFLVSMAFTNVPRWRGFFITVAAFSVICGCIGGPMNAVLLFPVLGMMSPIAGLVLCFVVFLDVTQRIKYPWTHWVGVGIAIWITVVMWLLIFLIMASRGSALM